MAVNFPASVIIDQGRDFYLTVIYKDANGTVIDLTGYSAIFALSQGYGSTILLNLSVGSGITITGSSGQIDLHASQSQTDIAAGSYTAELIISSPSSIETSLLKGNIVVSAKVVA